MEEIPANTSPVAETPAVETLEPELETHAVETPDIQIVDETGEVLDMASQESAEVLAGGDPWWMVGLTKYSVLLDTQSCPSGTLEYTCWESADPINEALFIIDAYGYVPTNGLINVEAGEYPGFTLDDHYWYNNRLIKGVIGAGSTVSTINGDVDILNHWNSFTLSGFTINGGVTINDSSGSLILQDLNISNPDGKGIEITGGWDYDEYWDEYYEYPHFGSVTLVDVRSNNNAGAGARVYSQGLIKVSNSTFNDNNWDGSDLDREADATPPDPVVALELRYWNGNVSLNGVIANGNNGSGIVVDAGTVTIKNVIANDNTAPTYDGDLHDYSTCGLGISVSSQNTGTNMLENITTDGNSNTGLDLYSWMGTFTLKNIQANFNQGSGIWMYASNGSASLTNIEVHENDWAGLDASCKKRHHHQRCLRQLTMTGMVFQ